MEYTGPQVHPVFLLTTQHRNTYSFHTDNSTSKEGIQADGQITRFSVMASTCVLRASVIVLGLLV